MCKPEETSKLETSKPKWSHWSPLAALTTKSEKRKTLDDSALENSEVKVVALRSYDFTGLGFNICGNIKDGIYIKDISHRGPAFVSGKLNPGDRISSITISFEHIVYEDALNILSYASPYEVIIEAKSGKVIQTPTQGGQPIHPMYKSTSCTNLWHSEKSPGTRLFADTPNSSLQKQKNHVTNLERKDSKSPNVNQAHHKKSKPFKSTPEIKPSPEPRVAEPQPKAKERLQQKSDLEVQKTESKFQKFGVKVLPLDQKSPKTLEQNENNINIEKLSIDEVDDTKMAKPSVAVEKERFERGNMQGSGIKRDKDGIPQEIPEHMFNAALAVAAKRNRNSMPPKEPVPTEPKEEPRTPKKKGKAPSPPDESKTASQEITQKDTSDSNSRTYNTDSEEEVDNSSSVNTMELNSSDITIHQTEQHEDKQNRKTVSTGDLTRIQNTKKTKIATGTLERAQSLDISESTIPPPLHKENLELMKSEEDLFGKVMLTKEPRLSLILDGLNTFQRSRLKKSTEWGNLEDAILKLNQEDDSIVSLEDNQSLDRSSLNETSPEFDAVVNKINEIKRESLDGGRPVKNAIWPDLNGEEEVKKPKMNNGLEGIKPLDAEIMEEVVISKPDMHIMEEVMISKPYVEDNAYGIPTKPISPPRLKKVNNRIDEPFEKATPLSTAENRQVKASVAVKPPPEVVQEPVEPPKVMKRISRQRVPEDNAPTLPSPDRIFPTEPATSEWEENIMNTSPPPSLTLDDPTDSSPQVPRAPVKPQEILSQIPLLNSLVQNETIKDAVLINNTDEAKSVVTYNTKPAQSSILDVTQSFLYTEQLNSCQDDAYPFKMYGTNVSDDIKVSRHTQSSPKSDDAKSKDSHRHVSNINVTNNNRDLHSLEFSVNDDTEHYTTALDVSNVSSLEDRENGDDNRVTILTPDLIKNVTLAEAIQTLEKEHEENNSNDTGNSLSLTYVTEIQVTPQNSLTNVSEVEVLSGSGLQRNLDTEFENYVKSFEAKLEQFESNIHGFDHNLEEFIKEEPRSIVFNESIDEKELNKIHEIAEEQLKKLPEMRFTTASYEAPSKIPEKRSSIEQLKSNFEKSPSKSGKTETPTKSRIPIATTTKTPPMSPERRDSRTFDPENDKALLELITSTPYAAKPKPSSKNVTVTSIRNTSKIPSSLPTLSGRPPVAPRKPETNDNTVHVPVNGSESHNSFKQWVFNPSNVTNVTVTQNKQEK
ncbi:unnamed protein product [Acanthoscelides obtectus]|uniref:PDZ domain-containing protein n=1 Tax=Acanthoscelides obtectus TaxID=200917 RepID=A0A9P0LEL5_ACAOB|nr:unnamed protein product [Acanthoscelides obtectus]CAK1620000.1 Periaxin [Acanthoscelides obtectus]